MLMTPSNRSLETKSQIGLALFLRLRSLRCLMNCDTMFDIGWRVHLRGRHGLLLLPLFTREHGLLSLRGNKRLQHCSQLEMHIVLTCMESQTLQKGQHYVGAPLIIPITVVFDVFPYSHGQAWKPLILKSLARCSI